MGDELPDAMNLDLNLGPELEVGSGSMAMPSETVNLAEFIEEPARRIRGALRVRTRQRRRRRRRVMHIAPETRNISMGSGLNRLMANPGNVGSLQAGEGSGASAEERTVKINGFLEHDDSSKRVDTEKGCGSDDRGFYDCNICFDLAKDPVVTLCGHLFCWPCIYRWLHEFSDVEECPVCKGEAAVGSLTPIYGCGSSTHDHEPEEASDIKIPARPRANTLSSIVTQQLDVHWKVIEEERARLVAETEKARESVTRVQLRFREKFIRLKEELRSEMLELFQANQASTSSVVAP